ncbi:MAG TPA: hypothetical protein VGI10_17175 [Polyangiaceae bacterium]|jgi:hypothetical protein
MTARSSTARRLRIPGASLAAVALLVTVAGGLLHTRAGRPLLAKLSGHHCPFARGVLEPAQRDALRHQGLAAQPHLATRATAHPALGFELGKVKRDAVLAWASVKGTECKTESKGAGLACGQEHENSLYFRFNAGGTLVGVLSMLHTKDVEQAVTLANADEARLRAAVGEPSATVGEPSATYLASGALRQSRAEHRFIDFAATASVTNLGRSEYLVTEEAELVD